MAKITFLGTADAIPSSSRNHTSILLTHNEENILFDCGEGTQRQFRKAKINPGKVTRILISHWHGDHVLGLPGLLSTLSLSGYNKKLFVYGPVGTKKKFLEMLKVFSFVLNYEIIFEEVESGKLFETDEFFLEAEEMEHGINCLAYNFVQKGHLRIKKEIVSKIGPGPHLKKLKDGSDIIVDGKKYKSKDCVYKDENKKLSIVLDTKMNKKIVPFVKLANVLISEGTFLSSEKKDAEEKHHLTVKQVGQIARRAKVVKLFVTHVSSRYSKNFKDLLSEVKEEFSNVSLPKDLETFEF